MYTYIFVNQTFPDVKKVIKKLEMITSLISESFIMMFNKFSWKSDEAKNQAINRLETMNVNIFLYQI